MKHNISFTSNGKHQCLVWLTDLHLDAAKREETDSLLDLVAAHRPDALFLGGDIGNGEKAFEYLERFAHLFEFPIYFVLGNHDFYYGSIEKTRELAKTFPKRFPHLHYLTQGGVYSLSSTTALIGHDGWSDARAGNFQTSDVVLNDYLLIKELTNLTTQERQLKLNELGTEAATALKKDLQEALCQYSRVILLIHTPPFAETSYYGEYPCNDNWSPHFVCQAAGEMIKTLMSQNKDKELLILCGHTHTGIDKHILPNIRVLTGESILGAPSIQGVIYID